MKKVHCIYDTYSINAYIHVCLLYVCNICMCVRMYVCMYVYEYVCIAVQYVH